MPYFQRTLSPGSAPAPSAAALERSAAGIVERATSILDKQLAISGTDPETTRPAGFAAPTSPGTILEGGDIYKRAHELLQGLLKLFVAPSGSVPSEMRVSPTMPATAPVLQSRPAKAGETLTVAVPLTNDSPNPADLIFYSSDFVSDGGCEISSLQVSFSPRTMTLAAHAKNYTDMKIAVPPQSPAGIYSALVQATGLSAPQAIVVLKVE